MKVLHLRAVRFIRPIKVGRTGALLLGCEDDGSASHEVVVKLRGPAMTVRSQLAELVAAQLADSLGLEVPAPAVVDVPVGFDAIISDPLVAAAVRTSAGSNFGSKHLGPGLTIWPKDRTPIGPLRDLRKLSKAAIGVGGKSTHAPANCGQFGPIHGLFLAYSGQLCPATRSFVPANIKGKTRSKKSNKRLSAATAPASVGASP